ncbi:MAG: GNAT family N-acetyltransferase [Planctomycetaceae bacterium]
MVATFFTLEELGMRSSDGTQNPFAILDDTVVDDAPCVLEINDLATLSELQTVWGELLGKTPQPAFSQTLEWLTLYWQHFGDQERLRVFCLDEEGETAGLTVLVERMVRGLRELTLPSVGGEALWPLGTKPAKQWRAVTNFLRGELARKHVLDLRGVPDPHGQVHSAMHAAEVKVQAQPWTSSTTLRWPNGFESLWSQVSLSIHSLVEFGEQRLAALGPTNFVRFRPQGTDRTGPRFPDELYQDCLNIALNDESQLTRADSVMNAPERHLFLRDLLPWAWQHSAADLCLLLSGTRPIAFRFHTQLRGHLRTVWTGVDAEFRQLPLATLLLFRTLRDSCRRGDKELDLGPTHAEVARDWSGTLTPLRRFVVGASATMTAAQQPDEMNRHGH